MKSGNNLESSVRGMRLFAIPMATALILALFGIPSEKEVKGEDSLPQVVRGEGVLAVAFGDARAVLGRAMVQKADSYFHGGIDMDCHLAHDGHHDHHDDGHHDEDIHDDHHHDEEHHHHEHHHQHDEEHHHHDEHSPSAFSDLWGWINARVRAPQVHKHLDGKKSVELMPWLWASVAADPHNIESWTTAAYVAGDMMKDRALALRILKEGEAKNPKSVRLRFYEGRACYNRGKGDLKSAISAFESARDLALRQGLSVLSEEELQAYEFSTNFIAQIQR